MTKEEKIKGLYSLKEYLVKNPIELEGHKSLPITLIDYAIEALEQEPKSEWEQDHAILKAYSDGANDVLNKIRAEIGKSKTGHEMQLAENDTKGKLLISHIYCDIVSILDTYKGESEDT